MFLGGLFRELDSPSNGASASVSVCEDLRFCLYEALGDLT